MIYVLFLKVFAPSLTGKAGVGFSSYSNLITLAGSILDTRKEGRMSTSTVMMRVATVSSRIRGYEICMGTTST